MSPDMLQREMEAKCRDIGGHIGAALPDGVGFALLIFEFGGEQQLAWISNADRADMVKALRECANRLEGAGHA